MCVLSQVREQEYQKQGCFSLKAHLEDAVNSFIKRLDAFREKATVFIREEEGNRRMLSR